MSPRVATLSLFLSLAVAGCTKAGSSVDDGTGAKPQPQPQPQPAQSDVMVELSAVTLGDDCGTPPPPPPKPARNAKPAAAAPPASMTGPSLPADCAEPDCGTRGYRNCHQTSIQLAMEGRGTGAPLPVRIKKVELLDAKGTLIGELAASKPGKWSDASATYEPWDQNVAMGELPAVSYVLSSPKWWEMEGGQYAQTGKTFQVRVTLSIGAKDRVVEKQAIQPTMMPPPVPT